MVSARTVAVPYQCIIKRKFLAVKVPGNWIKRPGETDEGLSRPYVHEFSGPERLLDDVDNSIIIGKCLSIHPGSLLIYLLHCG